MATTATIIPTLSILHGYLNAYNWDRVEEICTQSPHLLKLKLPNDNTTLHEICSIGSAPNHLLATIVKLYPDAAMISNRYGDLPLHIKCRNSQRSVFGVRLLLSVTSKEGLETVNHLDHTPLATACTSGAWWPVLYELVDAHPQSLLFSNMHGLTCIDLLWSSFIKTVPGASAVASYLRPNNRDARAMSGVLKRFMEKFCYIVCRSYQVQFLECIDQSLRGKDSLSNSYLETDCQQVISNLLCHAILFHDIKHAPQDLLHIAMKNNPTLGTTVDPNGNTIHHLLAENGSYSSLLAVVKQCGSKGFRITNRAKRLPLHIALHQSSGRVSDWKMKIKLISSANLDSVGVRDPMTGLYPFQAASTAMAKVNDIGCQDVEVVWKLLLENPALIDHTK